MRKDDASLLRDNEKDDVSLYRDNEKDDLSLYRDNEKRRRTTVKGQCEKTTYHCLGIM